MEDTGGSKTFQSHALGELIFEWGWGGVARAENFKITFKDKDKCFKKNKTGQRKLL